MNKTPLVDRLPVVLYLILALLALIVIAAVYQTGLLLLLFLVLPLALVGGIAYLVQGAARRRRLRALLFAELEKQGRALLHAAPDDSLLPALLEKRASDLFPNCDIVVWLHDGSVLFQQAAEGSTVILEMPLAETPPAEPALTEMPISEMGDRLAADSAGYCYWSLPPHGRQTLLVAIGNPARGGICIVPPEGEAPVAHLPAGRAVADQLDGMMQIGDRFSLALTEQANSYEEAIFSEAYRAEMLAQTLAFQRMEQELAVAWRIQMSFLPEETPEIAGWQLAALLEPAREMSGDFFDFIPLPNEHLGIVVADVADKGLGPALFMALCRTLIRTYAESQAARPDQVMATVNRRILQDTRSDLFVTVFYAVIDTRSGSVNYCNAGHNPPYLLRAGSANPGPGELTPLTRTSLPLGIMEDLEEHMGSAQLEQGDVLVLYTDGVTEAQDEESEFYGEERLCRVIQKNQRRSAQLIGEKVVGSVYDFMGDEAQHDDITLMVVVRERAVD